jgi:AraC-like DNA-binding protein
MNHHYEKPDKLISASVRTVLLVQSSHDATSDKLPAFTNGMPTLLCKTQKEEGGFDRVVTLTLFGGTVPDNYWQLNNASTIIAYFFKPFALTTLFKVASKRIAKNPLDLSDWSPHRYNALQTQLAYADTAVMKLEVVNNLIVQLQKENQELIHIIQHATEKIMNSPSNEILPEILTDLRLNERTFQRTFKRYVGVTATHFRRICQFQSSFEQLRSRQFEKVSDVAFDNGFADQSHFIRSFKEFTETTPNDYLNNGLGKKK